MEAQAPSSYTGFLQQPWYGVFNVNMHMEAQAPSPVESYSCFT